MKRRAASAPSLADGSTHAAPARLTPHRLVVSVALAIFLPAVWLVLNGNLSVQTALVRFIAALLVSWFAAWLVFATAIHSTGSAANANAGAVAGPLPPARHGGQTGPGSRDAAGQPDETTPAPVT